MALWKASFKQEKKIKAHERFIKENDTADVDIQSLLSITDSKEAENAVRNLIQKKELNDSDINLMATHLFVCLSYKNFQRPGPGINITVQEADQATFQHHEEIGRVLRVIVTDHKTASTYGPAILFLTELDAQLFLRYHDQVRPNIPTASQNPNFLVRANGVTFANRCKRLGMTDTPITMTKARKAGAQFGRDVLPDKRLEQMSRQMTHSALTSEHYYRSRSIKQRSLEAFADISKLSSNSSFKIFSSIILYLFLYIEKQKSLPKPPQDFKQALKVYFKNHIDEQNTTSLLFSRVRAWHLKSSFG